MSTLADCVCLAQEQDVLKNLVVPCEINPLPVHEVEIDEFGVRYTANEKMHIQNDTITLNYRLSGVQMLGTSPNCFFQEGSLPPMRHRNAYGHVIR